MGAQGSKPDVEQTAPGDTSFFSNRDQPIQFSESLINHLSSQSLPSSSVPSSRQAALDQHIQQRITSELQHLRQQEQQVRDEIERALEKENLDRERGAAEGEAAKGLSHSATLMKDLEGLLERSAGLRKQREETDEWRALDDGKKALHKCFLENAKSPLNCRDEAERFKQAVAGVEKAFFATVSAN
ncbi:hypothetical protein NBRC10512_004037 [Rhodotorula toruloides]|uniref:RHTO0S03e08504g1_1 n=2 Tax=Rhodotorula toruloides TaxID=5286 RepID=A0A061AL80_RHOTO|nr:DUF1690 domain protein [Rhodotorula toruloides NP11]EMS25981.1 DUF1690 domain protein [Rhodotorula toruloides NP11]CDR38346.1 RHTO0S03e08504g1_1 [Rhodotorula toruloides]